MVRLNRAGGAKTYKYFETIVKSWKFNENFDTNKNFDRVKSPSKFLLLTLVSLFSHKDNENSGTCPKTDDM